MSLAREIITPAIGKFGKLQWFVTGMVLGFFLGFMDTLLIAMILGYLHIQVPAYMGIPTTFVGYFFAGVFTGRFAPKEIDWEPALGVVVTTIFMMWTMMGFQGHGTSFFLYFVVIPALAGLVAFFGYWLARTPQPISVMRANVGRLKQRRGKQEQKEPRTKEKIL